MIYCKDQARLRVVSHNLAAFLRLSGLCVLDHKDTVTHFESLQTVVIPAFCQTPSTYRDFEFLASSLQAVDPLTGQKLYLAIFYTDSARDAVVVESHDGQDAPQLASVVEKFIHLHGFRLR